MPAKPSYARDLPNALVQLREDPQEWVDRKRLENLLRISKSAAWRLLRQAGGQPGPGNTLVCRRDDLIGYFERVLNGGGAVDYEAKRRQRLESYLASIRPQVIANRTLVTKPSEGLALLNSRFASLPANVELTPRSLHLNFATPEEFLAGVGAVIFALNNDYEKIAGFINGTPPTS